MRKFSTKLNSRNKKNSPIITSMIIACLIFAALVGSNYMHNGMPVNPQSIIINDVSLADVEDTRYINFFDKQLEVRGTHKKDYLHCIHIRFQRKGDSLYLIPLYTLESRLNPYQDDLTRDFEFIFADSTVEKINKVYLKGWNHHKPKLIWSR